MPDGPEGGATLREIYDPEKLVGTLLADRYRVERKLGAGGMGVVFAGTQEPLGRPVALKVLLEAIAHDPTAAARFEREAQAIARLNHPNIVTVYEFGRTQDGLLFLAMELVDGKPLSARIAEGPLQWEESKDVVRGIAAALAEAHAAGIVHRDLKPENIMLLHKGGVKVLDFGLARMSNADPAQKLTRNSIIMGTPGFIAPEQVKEQTADARSDLYAIGMIWWEMLVGRPPFVSNNPIELLVTHTSTPLPSPLTARPACGAPPRGDALILRLGAKDPRERPADGVSLLGELKALEDDAWQVSGVAAPLAGANESDWAQAFDHIAETRDSSPSLVQPPTESFEADALPKPHGTQPLASLSGPAVAAPGSGPSAASPSPPPSPSPTSSPAPAAAGGADEIVDGDDPFAGLDAHVAPDEETGAVDTLSAPTASPPSPASEPAPPKPAPEEPPVVHEAVRAAREGEVESPEDFRARFFDLPGKSAAPAAPEPAPAPAGAPSSWPGGRDAPAVGRAPDGRPAMEVVGAPIRPEVRWRVRVQGVVQGPFEFAEVVDMVRRGSLKKRDDVGPEDEPFRPLTSYPLLARELQSKKGTPMTSSARGATAASPLRRVLFALAFLTAAGAGVLYGLAPGLVDEKLQALGARASHVAGGPVPSPLTEHLVTWGNDLGQPGGTAAEYIARARTLLARETVTDTLEAEEALRRALLLEPENARAVAGLVEARVRLPAHARPDDDVPLEAALGFAEALAPGEPAVRRARGALALSLGDVSRARASLLRAQQGAPDDGELLLLLARADLERPQRARAHVRRALELTPDSTRARAVAGMVHRRLGEHAAAVEYLSARTGAEPRDPLAARELSAAHLYRGELKAAVAALVTARAAQPDAETDWALVHTLHASPRTRGRIDSILAESSKHVGVQRRAADLLALRAERLRAARSAQQALVVAEDAVARYPDHARAQTALARVYADAGRLPDARAALARARSHIRTNDEAFMVALADAHVKVLTGTAPADAFEGVVAAAPHRPGARLAWARALVEAGEDEAARAVLFALREADPAYWLDRPLADTWRPDFDAWARAANGKSGSALLLSGVLAFHAGDRRRASAAFTRALKRDPAEPVALLHQAVLDLRADRVASAYKRLQRLDAQDDDPPVPIHRYVVVAAARAGDDALATSRTADLPDTARDAAERETALGVVAVARDEPKKARFHFQRALVKDPVYSPPHEELRQLPVAEEE